MAFLLAFLFSNQAAHALAAPTITPGTGSFITSQSVTISGPGGASLFYTTDGSQPSTSSNSYSSAITISGPTQINAVAFSSGTYSAVTTVYLDISPDLAPILAPSGLILRLQAALGVTTGPGLPAPVSKWADLSGLGNDASSIYQRQPLLIQNAINGLPALSFDGTSQTLTLPSGFSNLATTTIVTVANAPPTGPNTQTITIGSSNANYSSGTSDTNTTIATGLTTAINNLLLSGVSATSSGAVITIIAPVGTSITVTQNGGVILTLQPAGCTLFIVTEPTALTANARILDLGDGATGNNVLCQISSSGSLGQFSTFSGTSGTNAQSAAALTNNQYQVLGAVQVPGSTHGAATFYVNGIAGTQNSSMNNIPNVARTSNFIAQGSSTGNLYAGRVCEILLYGCSLSNTQIGAVSAALAQKYQVLNQTPPAPIFSLNTGTLSGPAQVTISAQPGVVTRYTIGASPPDPTASSTPYTGAPITINYTQTLKAVAFKNGVASSVTSKTYTLDSTLWPAPSPSDMATPAINLQLPINSQ